MSVSPGAKMIRLAFTRIFIAAFFIGGFVFMPAPFSGAADVHDVKYFFDHTEPYRDDLPRAGLSETITVRGKLVSFEIKRRCKRGPCPPGRGFGLRDVANKKYMLHILDTSPFLEQLKINRVYILSGVLEKNVDFRRKKVSIFNFKPEKKIK